MTAPRDTILVVDPAGQLARRMPAQDAAASAAWVWLNVESLLPPDGAAADPSPSVAFVVRNPEDVSEWVETMTRLRAGREDLQIVVLDRHPDLERAQIALRNRVFDYLSADASTEALFAVAQRALESSRQALRRRRALDELVDVVGELARQTFQVDAETSGLRAKLQVAAEMDSTPGEPLSALVIEADPQAAAELLQHVRGRVTGELKVAGSADEAIQACRTRPYGLILVGATVEGIDVTGMVSRLREATPESILVVVVGFSSSDVAVRALRIGAAGFLIRPLDPREVSARLDDVLHQHQGRQRSRRYLSEFRQRLQTLVEQLAGPCRT